MNISETQYAELLERLDSLNERMFDLHTAYKWDNSIRTSFNPITKMCDFSVGGPSGITFHFNLEQLDGLLAGLQEVRGHLVRAEPVQ